MAHVLIEKNPHFMERPSRTLGDGIILFVLLGLTPPLIVQCLASVHFLNQLIQILPEEFSYFVKLIALLMSKLGI